MKAPLTPPLKWHGGKHYLAEQIIALMPRHLLYVEPYAGGLAVLLRRDPFDSNLWLEPTGPRSGVSEIVNDIDKRLTTFWRVLADPSLFDQLKRRLEATVVNRHEWAEAREHVYGTDPLEDAYAFFVFCRQSMAGRMNSFAPITRKRTRRQMNEQNSAWLNAIEGLPAIHDRLKRVLVENMPAVDLIRREDEPTTLFYLDPPYLGETRMSRNVYHAEMTRADHTNLLGVLHGVKGKVILSGYPSEMYDQKLAGWHRREIAIPNHAASGASKRKMREVLWMNFTLTSEE